MKKIILLGLALASSVAFAMSIEEVNNAPKEELMKIDGIGEKKADAIIAQREKESFKSFEDLDKIKGVGPSLLEKIKAYKTPQTTSKQKSTK